MSEEEIEYFGPKAREDYIKNTIRNEDPEMVPQLISLLNYLSDLGPAAIQYINKYKNYPEIKKLNMKLFSVAIFYYVKYGTFKPVVDLEDFLQDKYSNIVYEIQNQIGKGQRKTVKNYKNTENMLTEQVKTDLKINLASYLQLLDNLQ